MQDPYLYPGTAVLKNIENIKDEDELKKMESDYTILRLAELASHGDDWDAIRIIKRADETDWNQLSNKQQVQKFVELMADL